MKKLRCACASVMLAVSSTIGNASPASQVRVTYGDFNGDGYVDVARVDFDTARWYITSGKDGSRIETVGNAQITWGFIWYGQSANEILVCKDYDRDGITDPALYRPATGQWFIISSKSGAPAGISGIPWGSTNQPQGVIQNGKLLYLYSRDDKDYYVVLQGGNLSIYNVDGDRVLSGITGMPRFPGELISIKPDQTFNFE